MQLYIRKGRKMEHCGYKIRNIKADLANLCGLQVSTAFLIHNNLILEDHERLSQYKINSNDYIWLGTIYEYNEEFGDHTIIEIKADHSPEAMLVAEKVLLKKSDQISRIRSLLKSKHNWIEKVNFYNHKELLLDDQTIEECGLLENPIIVIKSPILIVTIGSLTHETKPINIQSSEKTQTIMRVNAYEMSPLMEIFRKLIDTNHPNDSILSRVLNFIYLPNSEDVDMKKQFLSLIVDWVKYFDKVEKQELPISELTSIFRQDFKDHPENASGIIELSSYDDHLKSMNRMLFLTEEMVNKYFPRQLYKAMRIIFNSLRAIMDSYLISQGGSNSNEKIIDLRLVNLINWYVESFINKGRSLSEIELGLQLIIVCSDIIPILCSVNSLVNDYWSSVSYADGNRFHRLYVNPNLDKDNAVHIMSATEMTVSEAKLILSQTNSSENDLSKEIRLATEKYDRFYSNEERLPSDVTISSITMCRHHNLEKKDLLGRGGYGKVYTYLNTSNGKLTVLKKLKIPENKKLEDIKEVIREINTFSRLAPHRRVMQYLNYYMEGKSFFIEMEYMKNGSLRKYLNMKGPLKIIEIRHFSHQILEGLKYLHKKGILHQDIRADNVLLDDNWNAKLTDFGLARCIQEFGEECDKGYQSSGVGPVRWMAPEIYLDGVFGFPADIWSFGVTVIEMVTGSLPYPDLRSTVVQIKIAEMETIKYDMPTNIELQKFIDSCLKKDINERCTVDELLESEFIRDKTATVQ